VNGRPEPARLGGLSRAVSHARSAYEFFGPASSSGAQPREKVGSGSETLESRLLVLSRWLLAFAALAIPWIDPSGPMQLVELTHASVAIYCVYSVVLAVFSYTAHWPAPNRVLHWIDL